jgi:ribonuclease R
LLIPQAYSWAADAVLGLSKADISGFNTPMPEFISIYPKVNLLMADWQSLDPEAAREAEKYDNPIPSRELILQRLADRGEPAAREELAKSSVCMKKTRSKPCAAACAPWSAMASLSIPGAAPMPR